MAQQREQGRREQAARDKKWNIVGVLEERRALGLPPPPSGARPSTRAKAKAGTSKTSKDAKKAATGAVSQEIEIIKEISGGPKTPPQPRKPITGEEVDSREHTPPVLRPDLPMEIDIPFVLGKIKQEGQHDQILMNLNELERALLEESKYEGGLDESILDETDEEKSNKDKKNDQTDQEMKSDPGQDIQNAPVRVQEEQRRQTGTGGGCEYCSFFTSVNPAIGKQCTKGTIIITMVRRDQDIMKIENGQTTTIASNGKETIIASNGKETTEGSNGPITTTLTADKGQEIVTASNGPATIMPNKGQETIMASKGQGRKSAS